MQRQTVDLDASPDENIASLAKAKGVKITEITACILARPRHEKITNAVRKTGAALRLIGDGDIAGVIHTTDPEETGIDIYFGVGGPNFTSSFHVIGEIFDKVYNLGGVTSEPLRGIQTVMVPAGGAVITEFKVDVPGNYTLVDHALARAERGLVGLLHVEGPSNSEIFDGKVEPGSGH